MNNENPQSNLDLFNHECEGLQNTTHSFGGIWTKKKLDVLEQYLKQFTTALSKNTWANKIYIDACAGTGECDINIKGNSYKIAGSAKLAIYTEPAFDEIILVERDSVRFNHLLKLKENFPKANVRILQGDCNIILPQILNQLSNSHRGVIFVDPYGMNISWDVIKKIGTKKLDMWYLFPLSGFYRQAANDLQNVDEKKAASILRILGDPNWQNALYKTIPGLFEGEDKKVRVATVNEIVEYVTIRLKTVFPYVTAPALFPTNGPKRFALYFALSNNSYAAINLANKISSHILKSVG